MSRGLIVTSCVILRVVIQIEGRCCRFILTINSTKVTRVSLTADVADQCICKWKL